MTIVRVPDDTRTMARHGRLAPSRPLLSVIMFVAIALAVMLVSGASVTTIALAQLGSNVETVALPDDENLRPPAPGIEEFEGGFTMLIVGSDECVDTGGCPGRSEKLNDFTMLLHVAEDHQSAVAVTFPRDLIVPIPACPREDGTGSYNAMSAQQINVTLAYGGLACTIVTVRALTGLPIPYAGIMTFNGVREISTALGGVPVCIDAPISDPYSGLNLPAAGSYLVEGEQALQFLRTRHGVGDGSDTGRIGSQQAFLASMVRKIKDSDSLSNFGTVLSLATAASKNMTLSDNLGNVTSLASMALVMKDIPLEKITFVKYPAGSREEAPGRVFPIQAAADDLFAKIAADEPFSTDVNSLGTTTDPAASTEPTPSPDPASSESPDPAEPAASSPPVISGATGQTAADQTCSRAF